MKNYLNLYLGEKLKVMRENKNIKQSEMALLFGMKQQSYSKIELGKTYFSNKIFSKIYEVFDMEMLDFVTNPIPNKTSIIKLNPNQIDDFTTRVIIASHRKQLAEQKLQIINLQIELMHHKQDFELNDYINPIYVMI